MKRYRVRQFTSSLGEETYLLIDPGGTPCYWPNYYVTIALRGQAMSPKTVRNHLTALARASDWMFAAAGSDFGDRVITGDPLLYNEAIALGRFLQLKAKAQANELAALAGRNENPARPRVVSLEEVRPNPNETNRERHDAIQNEGYASFLRYTVLYLEWAYRLRKTPARASGFGPKRQVFAEEGLRQLRSFIPRLTNKGDQDESLEGLSWAKVQMIEGIVSPQSPQNPWKNAFVRDRNHLMWRLFLETGGRRAEVHNILLANLQLSKGNVSFHVSKTYRRTVPFRAATRILIDDYIRQHWSKLPKWARRQGYLITSEAGHHLTERQVNRIFQELRRCSDQIPVLAGVGQARR